MREKLLFLLGKRLMASNRLRICIVDDKATYFNRSMLSVAAAAGFSGIERYSRVEANLMKDLLDNPPEIIILDIKGVADPEVAKDGFGIARLMYEHTNAYVVITSAHKFYVHEPGKTYDYVMEDRLLTSADFVEELRIIVAQCLRTKLKFYSKLAFRAGFALAQRALLRGGS